MAYSILSLWPGSVNISQKVKNFLRILKFLLLYHLIALKVHIDWRISTRWSVDYLVRRCVHSFISFSSFMTNIEFNVSWNISMRPWTNSYLYCGPHFKESWLGSCWIVDSDEKEKMILITSGPITHGEIEC